MQHLPLLVLLLSLTVELVLFDTGSFSFGFVGLMSSWIYLRWFQERPGNVTGDPSDEFKFSTFFPEQMQYVPASTMKSVVQPSCILAPSLTHWVDAASVVLSLNLSHVVLQISIQS